MDTNSCLCERVTYLGQELNRLETVIPSEFSIPTYSAMTVELVKIIVPCATSHLCSWKDLSMEEQFKIRLKKCCLGKEIQRIQSKIYPELINFYQKAYQEQIHIEQCSQVEQSREERYYSDLVREGYVGRDQVVPVCKPSGYINRQGLQDALNWFPTTDDNFTQINNNNTTNSVLESTPTGTGIDLEPMFQEERDLTDTLRWVDPTIVSNSEDFWNYTLPLVNNIQKQITSKPDPYPNHNVDSVELVLDHPRESHPLKIPINPIWKNSISKLRDERNRLLSCVMCCS